MPMRPEKCFVALASAVPRPGSEPLTNRLDNQPHSPSPPPPAPSVAESGPALQRTATSQRPTSLVVRNTRKSRNKPLYTNTPRSNHYLLARSLVEDDQPPNSLAPGRKSRPTRNIPPSQFCILPPDVTVSEFIWRFSPPDQDSQIYDTLAALKSYDPQTFSEFIAGFD